MFCLAYNRNWNQYIGPSTLTKTGIPWKTSNKNNQQKTKISKWEWDLGDNFFFKKNELGTWETIKQSQKRTYTRILLQSIMEPSLIVKFIPLQILIEVHKGT